MQQFSTLEAPLAPPGNSNHPSQSASSKKPAKREREDNNFQYEFDPSELRFPENANRNKQCTAWLVKLPPSLTNHWKELLDFDDNEEIVLGTIGIKVPKVPDDKQEMRLGLNPSLRSSQNIPQNYYLESRGKPRNMYCWAEEKDDLKEQTGPPIPTAFIERSRKKCRSSKVDGESKEPVFRRPHKVNKTSFVAKFQDELLATPVRAMGAPTIYALPKAVKTEPEHIAPASAQMNPLRPGTIGELPNRKGKELSFTAAAKPTLNRRSKDKAYRMNKDVLISSLYELFEAKEHWCLKEFREKLFQPENYMKQVLKEVAIYNHNGPMAGTWELNSDSKEALKLMKAQKNEN